MAKKIVSEMATQLTLGVDSAKASLRELTGEVKSASNEARQLEASYKASGDTLNASKAKYEGLQHVMESQRAKVSALETALKNNNTETEKGRALQETLTKELTKAQTEMGKYNGQMEKAKQSYQYQESGLAKLNQELKESNNLTKARVDRLEAEGKQQDANRVKLEGLKHQHESYNSILKIQKAELDKLAESGDKSSSAYKRQQLRVEQMAGKLAHAQAEIKSFNHTEIKPNTSGMSRVEGSLKSLDKKLEGTRSHFKSIFMGNLIANGVSNALGSIKSHLNGMLDAGVAYNKQMQGITIGLDNFTNGNAKLSGQLKDIITATHESSSYALDTTTLLTKKSFGFMGKNVTKADELSKAWVNVGRATGMSDEKLQASIGTMGKIAAAGDINVASLTKMNKQLPGFSAAMAKHMGISEEKLRQLAKTGKLSMEDLGNGIKEMSEMKGSTKGLENYYKTVDGFTKHFEDKYKTLSGKITEGFFSQSNGLLAGISKSLDGKEVDKAFGRIGSSANKAVNTVAKAFSSTFKGSKTNPIADMANFTADAIQNLGNFVAKHAKDIKNFFEMVKDLGSTGFSTMKTSLKIALPLLEDLGKFATKHPTTFKVLAASIVGVSLALKGTLATMNGFSKLSSLVIKPRVDGGPAKRELTLLGKAIKGSAKGIGKAVKFTASLATKGFNKALTGMVKGAKAAGRGIKTAFNFAKANPLLLIVTAVVAVSVALYELYKHNKKFRKFVNGLIKGVKDFVNKVVKSVVNFGKKIEKNIKGFQKKASNIFHKILSTIKDIFGDIRDFIGNTIAKIFNNWKRVWKKVSIFVSRVFSDIRKVINRVINSVKDTIGNVLGTIWNNWKNNFNRIKDFFGDTWNGIKGIGSRAINSVKDILGGGLGKIGKAFGDTWNGIKAGFGSFWDGLKQMASDGLNAVISPINSGIQGIDNLVHDFGGPKNAIGKIPEVHLATGTGAIDRLTHAVLNDGNDSPETGNKETLIHPNGKMEVVQGRNTQRLLLPGTEVLNASETKMLMAMQGVRHFANGTGFFGGIWKGIKGVGSTVANVAGDAWDGMKDGVKKFTKMFKFITNAVAHPIKTLEGVFNPKNGGLTGAVGDITGGFIKKAKNQVKDWWSELWSMANDASEAGSSAGNKGDDYLFKNKGADSGADPWGYFYKECVSFVASRLKQMGVAPHLFSGLGNGSDWVNAKVKHTKSPKPGDVAVYSAGSQFGNHVAMVSSVQGGKISGEEYNYMPDAPHKYHAYSGRPISGATTFLDFGKSMSSQVKEVAGNSKLSKLIKSQVGGMFKWIQKWIAPINDDGGSGGKAGDVQSWSDTVKKALEKNGLSTSSSMVQRVLRQIQTESSGNPKAVQGIHDVNSGGNEARGLMQTIPSTFNAYKFPGHGDIYNGYDNLLAALAYAKKTYGPSLSYLGNGHGYENGGLITKHQVAEIGEGNKPEMIIPLDGLKSSRGYELLGKTMSVMAARDNLASQSTNTDGLERLEDKFDTVIQLIGQLVTQGKTPGIAYVIANQASQEINKFNNNGSRLTRNAMG